MPFLFYKINHLLIYFSDISILNSNSWYIYLYNTNSFDPYYSEWIPDMFWMLINFFEENFGASLNFTWIISLLLTVLKNIPQFDWLNLNTTPIL